MAADEAEKQVSNLVPVDINDLSLADDELSINTDADAFAGPPPPDDGDHRVKLSLGDRKVQQGTIKKGPSKGQTYFMVHVQGKIMPGDPSEGRVTFDNASTMVMQNTGTCRVAGILKALGEPIPARAKGSELARRLCELLAGEPEVVQTTQWSGFCQDCRDEYENTGGKRGKKNGVILRGQRRFPENGNGQHLANVECKECGALVNARAEVMAYKHASSV